MSLLQPESTVRKDSTLERVKTGIVGLDNILQGGIPKYTTVLVSGQPGSGKTIFCYQFLYEGVKNKEKCLFLTLDKKVDGLLTQARELGIDFQPFIEEGLIKFLFLDINKKLVYETMTNEILSGGYNRIVLDSITPLSEMPIYINELALNRRDISIINPDDFSPDGNFPIRRLHLHYIMNVLENSKATCVVTSELPVGSNALSRDGISEFLADGVIVLTVDTMMDRRKIAVVKMRSTKHSLKPQEIDIVKGGIQLK